ncbi:cupin domain-containing protein [Gottschalkiaceae bacterium SANA]|nr:cupin domain-containing protein [Gottschalkiaceae bacterium SANA]
MFIKNNQVTTFDLAKGISSKILAHDENLMIVENTFSTNAIAHMHQHPHEQAGYVLSGVFEFAIAKERQILQKGDSFVISNNMLHSCRAIVGGIILDIFTPCRNDLLVKSQNS